MNFRFFTLFVIAILLFFNNQPDSHCQISSFFKKKQTEKEKLQKEIDSLKRVISDYAYILEHQDSVSTFFFEDENTQPDTSKSIHITDSLLNEWYINRALQNTDEDYDVENVLHLDSSTPDSLIMERLKKINSPISIPYNSTVRDYIILYSEKMPTRMSIMLEAAKYYMPIFESIFNKYGIPEELKYLAIIESALNPLAVSRAGAKGMWQFMYGTAKLYGLKINSYVDERLDPVKSAEAAARYLKDAYNIFGDWNLAISSYNCGSGNVNKAIRRCGSNKDFWAIYNYLPRETRGYVPAFVGAMYAFNYAKEHGLKPVKSNSIIHVDTFHINKNLHFKQIEEIVGIPAEITKKLNPQYMYDIIPGNEETQILRIPSKYISKFIEKEDTLYLHRAKELFNPAMIEGYKHKSLSGGNKTIYVVKKGDSLGKIAGKYRGVTVTKIKQWNHLKNNNLQIGQRLLIYR